MQAVFEIINHGLSLKLTGILLGIALIAVHALALIKRDILRAWLPTFPRSRTLGIAILTVDLVWSWIYVAKMDLGEFHTIRGTFLIILPVAYLLVIKFVDEFLAVRAFGAFLLLLACPVLGAAFLEEPVSRLLLPIIAYAWILFGLFWVGMPYLMRDQISWILAREARFRNACIGGVAYGTLALVCALAFY